MSSPASSATTEFTSHGMDWVRDAIALTKPRITASVVLTAAGGMWLAPDSVSPLVMITLLLTTAAIVGGANALNCWLERDSDRLMTRTAKRPLPDGRLAPRVAFWLGCLLAALSIPTLCWVVNPLTGLLGAIALVSYVAVYTPMKRSSSFSLLVGSVPGAMPPLMGWAAATNSIDPAGVVLFGIMFLWQVPHFIAISIFREQEYARAGLKTLPGERGAAAASIQAMSYAGVLLVVSILLFVFRGAGMVYLLAALILGIMQFAASVRLVRSEGDPKVARKLFFVTLIYLVGLFCAIALDALFRSL